MIFGFNATRQPSKARRRADRRLRPSLGGAMPSLALETRFMASGLARAAGFSGTQVSNSTSFTQGSGDFPPNGTTGNGSSADWIDPAGVWIQHESGNVTSVLSDSSSVIDLKVQYAGSDRITNLTTQAVLPRATGEINGSNSGNGLNYTAAPGNYTVSFTANFQSNGDPAVFLTAANANVTAGGYTFAVGANGVVVTDPAGQTIYTDPGFGNGGGNAFGNGMTGGSGIYASPQFPFSLPNGGGIGVVYTSGLTSGKLDGRAVDPGTFENDTAFSWSLDINAV